MGNMFYPFKIRCQVYTQEFYGVNRLKMLVIDHQAEVMVG
jgi:hypothetical protein